MIYAIAVPAPDLLVATDLWSHNRIFEQSPMQSPKQIKLNLLIQGSLDLPISIAN